MQTIHDIQPEKPCRLIRITEVMLRTGLKRATIYDRLNPKSERYDPSFPKQRKLNKNCLLATGAVGWLESEVDAWILGHTLVCEN